MPHVRHLRDLVVGEAFMSGIAGTVCWGTHRDTAAILAFGARVQAVRLLKGELLRTQLDLDRYVARRNSDPNYTFREHLKTFGGAIEI
jgi:hypothetical protein